MTWLVDAVLYLVAGFMVAGFDWARVVFTWGAWTLAVIFWGKTIKEVGRVQREEEYRARFIGAQLPAVPTLSTLGLLIACLFAEAWFAVIGLSLLLIGWVGRSSYQRQVIAETRLRHEAEVNGRVYH